MISISQKVSKYSLLLLVALITVGPSFVFAQESLTYSVSPTIFDMTANPGQTFRSTVRIINVNPYELNIFVDVADFVPKGETGTPRFIPVTEQTELASSLAKWVSAEKEVNIPAEKTVEVPFTITVPQDASPGGHFAALMISTKPKSPVGDQSQVQTAQVISSLIFLRVTGDITENSSIRSFRTTNYFLSKPEATFELRIENKGNVHVQPQGEITIYNMWGQERGQVKVNQQSLFGNVLPNSVRKYSFTWTGEWSPTDIGRYTAVATLGYGFDEKQFMHADTAFWIIPWKFLLAMFAVIGGFIALMSWAIKLYVRRVLALAGVQQPGVSPSDMTNKPEIKTAAVSAVTIPLSKGGRRRKPTIATVVAPIEVSILDLRSRLDRTKGILAAVKVLGEYVKTYWRFFVSIAAIIIFLILVVWFVKGASTPNRDFEVIIDGDGQDVTVSSDDMEPSPVEETEQKATTTQSFSLILVNRSGDKTLSDKVKELLEANGYPIFSSQDEEGKAEERTVIVYDPKVAKSALELSSILDNALLSSYASEQATTSEITVYLGTETIEKISQ